MAKKLAAVLAESRQAAMKSITVDEANVLVSLSMAPIEHSEKARKALTRYLDVVLESGEVEDDQARVALNVLRQAATSKHKELCNKVLSLYLSKFDAEEKKEQPVAA